MTGTTLVQRERIERRLLCICGQRVMLDDLERKYDWTCAAVFNEIRKLMPPVPPPGTARIGVRA